MTSTGHLHAVVFDFDGLILDTETSSWSTAAEVFTAHGQDLSLEWWHTIIGTADHPHWSEILESRLGSPLPDRERVLAERLRRHHELVAAESVRPGVVELLGEVSAAGVRLAVASSSSREWVEGHLQRLGLRGLFEVLCCREDVGPGRSKPHPDLYQRACERLGAPPSRAVALEDSPNGVRAAKAAGMYCVGVPAGLTAGLDLSEADRVVSSLAELGLAELAALVPG